MNREAWLTQASNDLQAAFFNPNALAFANPVRISTGWCRGSKKAIGQCWASECSEGKFSEIFISPVLNDAVQVMATLLHELIHAHLGNGKGHGKEFKALCNKFGLAGRVTATFAEEGSELFASLKDIAEAIGEYPHKKLLPRNKVGGEGEEKKGGWIRFKSINEDTYRCMVSPVSLEKFGIPKDPWGEELILVKEAA